MKKILGLAFGLMMGAFTFAQSPVTFTEDLSSYDKNATTVFHFNSDETITYADLSKNMSYYTDYFTVDIVAASVGHDLIITLVQDDEMSRKVIHRYFASLQVPAINVNGSDMDTPQFMETYIQK